MQPIEISTFPGRTLETDNKQWLYCGGTAYLGLQSDPSFQQIFIENIQRYGTSYGASRNSNVRFSVYEEAEAELARWAGSADALTMSSGYLAAQLVCQNLQGLGCNLHHLPGSHPALSTAPNERNPVSIQELATAITESPNPALLVDSIDFHGQHYPHFEKLRSLPLEDLTLVVDDSHGIGAVGPEGSGSYAKLSELGVKELIVCASLNKALALQAGCIFGSKERIAQLRSTAFFTGASPTSPAVVATFLSSRSLYLDRYAKLKENLSLFLSLNKDVPYFEYNSGHPAFSLNNPDLANHLEANDILITRFQYPTEKAKNLARIVLTASHTAQDIEKLSKAIQSFV
ncbi:aminotransferase class I/II-fold pyridoxal phosphate-dependent enzyme [Pelagicoccus enzymogenes]|uniref:aminotransferase class I/II-fold pyridoxal phosphate-dependent enzyme n=1 Tax=Pelagicoccus enzymogenes TaxID=2773457 RepID=UPI00280F83F7|nr:aminotransferase class I/II-fold pyridoxal phosphate-dependent enzyme [Pelagicoccus enzymogenes]MDQ8197451.1 aminotransferase class I/II-fold pyridoxal phosphate-dependent enzyme [Pelagicoccus enzymogenes]